MSESPLTPEELAAYTADAKRNDDDSAGDLLSQITNVVREIMEARGDVEHAEEVLKTAQQRVRTLEEFTLPELMRQARQEKLRTADGYDVELTEILRASIPAANLERAIMWLTANGQGAIVKRELKLNFGKNEDQKAANAYDIITKAGFHPSDKQTVHPQTLSATLRELIEQGVDVPLELLGAHVQPVVKIKEGKPSKR